MGRKDFYSISIYLFYLKNEMIEIHISLFISSNLISLNFTNMFLDHIY